MKHFSDNGFVMKFVYTVSTSSRLLVVHTYNNIYIHISIYIYIGIYSTTTVSYISSR